jgi:hypothetical protein
MGFGFSHPLSVEGDWLVANSADIVMCERKVINDHGNSGVVRKPEGGEDYTTNTVAYFPVRFRQEGIIV